MAGQQSSMRITGKRSIEQLRIGRWQCLSFTMGSISQWFLTLLERLKHCRDRLRCPECWRMASPATCAKGRYLLGTEQFACDQCGETSVAAAWRLRAIVNAGVRQRSSSKNTYTAR